MQDVIFVAVMIGFFGLCVLLVRACDWIIGPDEQALAGSGGGTSPDASDEHDLDDEAVAA
jgi:hypothetical protein